jgi:hypothetical protein
VIYRTAAKKLEQATAPPKSRRPGLVRAYDVRKEEVLIPTQSVSFESHAPERLLQRGSRQWIVREVNALGVPGARRDTCLLCESAEVIRRIWDFPSNWRSVDDEALWKLCDGSAR